MWSGSDDPRSVRPSSPWLLEDAPAMGIEQRQPQDPLDRRFEPRPNQRVVVHEPDSSSALTCTLRDT